jgi:hypothetical protein
MPEPDSDLCGLPHIPPKETSTCWQHQGSYAAISLSEPGFAVLQPRDPVFEAFLQGNK